MCSEVAKLRERIRLECEAMERMQYGFAQAPHMQVSWRATTIWDDIKRNWRSTLGRRQQPTN